MGYPHQVVIYNMCQVIERKAIRLENDRVVNIGIPEGDISMNLVMHNRLTIFWHSEAHHPLESSRLVRGPLLVRKVAAVSVVARRQLLCRLGFAHLLQALSSTVTTISVPRFNQLVSILLVERLALRLIIRTIWATDKRTLVIINVEPAHPIQQYLDSSFYRPGNICIFNAQNE